MVASTLRSCSLAVTGFFRHRFAWTAALVSVVTACSQTPPPVAQAKVKPKPKPAVQQTFDDSFVHPVPSARVSSSFANYIVKSRNRKHHGTDFAAPIGTPVYATRSGVVLSADNTSLSGDFGNAVLIEHGDQFQSLSAHLSRIDVQMGTWVQAGQQIGLVGKTGRATGAHLHFELWQNNLPKDPLQFLPITESQRLAVKKPEAAAPQVAKVTVEIKEATSSKTSKKQTKSVSQHKKTKKATGAAKNARSQTAQSKKTAAVSNKKTLVATTKPASKTATKATFSKTKSVTAKAATTKKTVVSKNALAKSNKPVANSKSSNSRSAEKSSRLSKNTTQAPGEDKESSQKKSGGMR